MKTPAPSADRATPRRSHPVRVAVAVGLALAAAVLEGQVVAQSAPPQVTIRDPGPDFGYFPDAPGLLPRGGVYLETSIAYSRFEDPRLDLLTTPLLARFGVVPDWEVRFGTTGLNRSEEEDGETTTGVGPLVLGFKGRLWQGRVTTFGIEGTLQLPTASAGFDDGSVEPSLGVLFQHALPRKWLIVWNLWAATELADAGRAGEWSLLWAVQRDVGEDFQVYATGSVTDSSADEPAYLTGVGFYWYASDRAAMTATVDTDLRNSSEWDVVVSLSLSF